MGLPMVLPPFFVKHLEVKKLNPPYCWACIHFANDKDGMQSVCMRFGAVVFLSSSCGEFERRVAAGILVVGEFEIREKFRWGLDDLTKREPSS